MYDYLLTHTMTANRPMNISDFFFTLFDEYEATSFARHQQDTKVFDVDTKHEEAGTWAVLYCINPLHATKDLNPTESYHSKDKPRRADANVVAYRNILVEMDSIPVEDQEEFITKAGLPYSTSVFSGGKSIHYIISLEAPVSDERVYRRLVERVHNALGGKSVVDVSCKNPSRLSRFPNGKRLDKDGVIQTLLSVKGRVPNQVLENWLQSRGIKETEDRPTHNNKTDKKQASGAYNTKIDSKRTMNGFTLNFIMCGAQKGERNISLFKAACDLFRCGYDKEQVQDRLEGPSGLDQQEVERTIKSAQRKVEAEQEQ